MSKHIIRLYHSMETEHLRDVYIVTELSVSQLGDLYSRLCKYLRKQAMYNRYILLMPDVFAGYLCRFFGAEMLGNEEAVDMIAWLCNCDHFAYATKADQNALFSMVASLQEVGQFDVFALWPYIQNGSLKEELKLTLKDDYVQSLVRYFCDCSQVHNGSWQNLLPLCKLERLYARR